MYIYIYIYITITVSGSCVGYASISTTNVSTTYKNSMISLFPFQVISSVSSEFLK